MSSFIKALALLLADREELNINVKKIGNDLVIFSTPGKDTKRAVKQVTIPEADLAQEDLDTKIIGEIGSKPDTSSATYNAANLPSGKKEKSESSSKKSSPAKKAARKAAPKKQDKKKSVSKAAPMTKRPVVKKAPAKQDKKKGTLKDLLDQTQVPKKRESIHAKKAREVVQKTRDNVEKEEQTVSENAESVTATQQPLPGASGKEEKQEPNPTDILISTLTQGDKHASAKNWQDAEDAYLKVLQMDPENETAKKGIERCKKWLAAIEKAEG